MREYTFIIFKQINPDCPMNDDPAIEYIHGTRKQAQEACDRYNSQNNGYHYFMELPDARKANPRL